MDELRSAFESIREKLKDLFDRVNQLEAAPTINSGGGGGAPVDAQYLVLAFNAMLTNERRLDFSARFATVDGGAGGDYDVDLAASGVGAGVYGSATQVSQVTVDTYGRVTSAANVAITGVPPVAHPLLGNTYHNDVTTQGPTRGSLIYGNATPLWDELVLGGISGSVLTRNATDVLWSTGALAFGGAFTLTVSGNSTINGSLVGNITGGGTISTGGFTLTVPATGTAVLGTGTTGYVAYWNGTNTVTGEAQLFYDAGNNRLGINDATPSYTLDLNGSIGINGIQTVYNPHALGTFTGTLYIGNGGTSLSHTGGSEGYLNTAVGIDALRDNTTGYINNAMGYSALANNTTGYSNDAHGSNSLTNNTIGTHNTAMGYFSSRANIDGSYNVAVGALAISRNASTSYNVAIGYNSGSNSSGGAAVTSVEYSTFIGNDARPLNNTETNQIVIGSASRGYGSNTATIGTATTTDFYAFGNHIIEEDHFIGITSGVRIAFDDSNGFIKATLGDAAGSDQFQIIDSGTNVVAYINSNGEALATEYYTSDGGSFGISGNELLTVNAAGTFAFTGISGITVENGDYIGITGDLRTVYDTTNGRVDNILGDAAGGDEWRVVDSGSGVAATIDSDGNGYFAGNVGIGGTPSYLLHLIGNDPKLFFDDNAGGAQRDFSIYDAASVLYIRDETDGVDRLTVYSNGLIGVNMAVPTAQLHVDQSNDAATIPVLTLDQADLSEEMINFIVASTGAGAPVDTATAVGATYARLRVAVNGTFKYIQLYNP